MTSPTEWQNRFIVESNFPPPPPHAFQFFGEPPTGEENGMLEATTEPPVRPSARLPLTKEGEPNPAEDAPAEEEKVLEPPVKPSA